MKFLEIAMSEDSRRTDVILVILKVKLDVDKRVYILDIDLRM